jgi:hypothetical protein
LCVPLAAQDGSDGLSDVGGRKHSQSDLIKQRLKGVMIAPVHDSHIHWQSHQTFGRAKSRKSAADNHDLGTARLRLKIFSNWRIGQFAQNVQPSSSRCAEGAVGGRIAGVGPSCTVVSPAGDRELERLQELKANS